MPELPEVETIRMQLARFLIGQKITSIDVFNPKSTGHNKNIGKMLIGNKITKIDRIGKLLIISINENSKHFLLIHLKMTGQLLYVNESGKLHAGGHTISNSDTSSLPGRHTRIAIAFEDNSTLYFNDMRLFGYMKIADKYETEQIKTRFGPEPIDPDFDVKEFIQRLKRKTAMIKPILLDQTFVAGLGNIYVDEALWRSGIRPTRRGNKISKSEAVKLIKSANEVLSESIKMGGTTFRDFVDSAGNKGNYYEKLLVFGKNDIPCVRCGTLIKKIKVAGRGTHYCPSCQS